MHLIGCAYDSQLHTADQDNPAMSEDSAEEEQIGSPLTSLSEQENEDEVESEETSEREELNSTQIIDYETDVDEFQLQAVQSFRIESILSEKIADGTTLFLAKFAGSTFARSKWLERKEFTTATEKQILKNWLKSKRSKGKRATVARSTVGSSRKTSGRPQRNKSQPARLSDYQLTAGKKNKKK